MYIHIYIYTLLIIACIHKYKYTFHTYRITEVSYLLAPASSDPRRHWSRLQGHAWGWVKTGQKPCTQTWFTSK